MKELLNKKININREIEFIEGVEFLINKYGNDKFSEYYWKPQFYKFGFPCISKNKKKLNSIEKDFIEISKKIENPKNHSIEKINNYNNQIDIIIKKTNFQIDTNISKDLLERFRSSIYRYWIIGALNNISLSVSPKIKQKWKINFELFGSFYNTQSDYCGLFGDIEQNSCDFSTFVLKPNMRILINPPYTDIWIRKSCKIISNIMEKNLNTIVYLVIPIWNNSDRLKLHLKIYDDVDDLIEIDQLKSSKYLSFHKILNLDFYNGIQKKYVKLKDKIHLFKFNSNL